MASQRETRIDDALARALADVAPEARLEGLEPRVSFHTQLELDSVDFMRLMTALERSAGVAIPGADTHQLATPEGARSYLRERLSARERMDGPNEESDGGGE